MFDLISVEESLNVCGNPIFLQIIKHYLVKIFQGNQFSIPLSIKQNLGSILEGKTNFILKYRLVYDMGPIFAS